MSRGSWSAMGRLWRAVPRGVRPRLLAALNVALAPRPDPSLRIRPGPCTVAGLFSSATGLGESARLCRAALCRLDIPTNAIDLSPRLGRADLPSPPALGPPPQAGEDGVVIVHLNAPHLPLVLAMIGRRRTRHKRIIGYWAWELGVLPRTWRQGFRYVHEVWVPSGFVANAVRRATDLPVRVVPHPVVEPARSSRTRADFGIPVDTFVLLSMFDMGSGSTRKNPLGAVRAFRQAFGERADACLTIKVGGANDDPLAFGELVDLIGAAPNIRLLHQKLTREDHGALLGCADAVISLHRSEGFGLMLAEAMRLGLPAVATGWSGNLQFMSERNAALVDFRLVPVRDPQGIYGDQDTVWAEPDVDQAAHWLRRLAEDPPLRHRLGAAAREDAAQLFSDAAYRAAIAEPLHLD